MEQFVFLVGYKSKKFMSTSHTKFIVMKILPIVDNLKMLLSRKIFLSLNWKSNIYVIMKTLTVVTENTRSLL